MLPRKSPHGLARALRPNSRIQGWVCRVFRVGSWLYKLLGVATQEIWVRRSHAPQGGGIQAQEEDLHQAKEDQAQEEEGPASPTDPLTRCVLFVVSRPLRVSGGLRSTVLGQVKLAVLKFYKVDSNDKAKKLRTQITLDVEWTWSQSSKATKAAGRVPDPQPGSPRTKL